MFIKRWILAFIIGASLTLFLNGCKETPQAFHFGTDPASKEELPEGNL